MTNHRVLSTFVTLSLQCENQNRTRKMFVHQSQPSMVLRKTLMRNIRSTTKLENEVKRKRYGPGQSPMKKVRNHLCSCNIRNDNEHTKCTDEREYLKTRNLLTKSKITLKMKRFVVDSGILSTKIRNRFIKKWSLRHFSHILYSAPN